MIKFYCNKCGKEIFIQVMPNFKEFKDYTLGEVEESCMCDECKEIANEKANK